MQILSKDIDGRAITSLRLGRPVAHLGHPIINPHDLSIPAFYVFGTKLPKDNPHALMTQDIREVSPRAVLIDDKSEITPISDLLRLQEYIKIDFQLINKPVATNSGKKLGRVEEYTIDSIEFKIKKIQVKQSIFRSLSTSNLIIDRKQVLNVTDKKIVVQDAVVDNKAPSFASPNPAA